MVRIIGVLLIISSVLVLLAGSIIGAHDSQQVTGSVIISIIEQPQINMDFLDYVEAIALSYSIVSFLMGLMFLIRV